VIGVTVPVSRDDPLSAGIQAQDPIPKIALTYSVLFYIFDPVQSEFLSIVKEKMLFYICLTAFTALGT
jgi:hypothetical protein